MRFAHRSWAGLGCGVAARLRSPDPSGLAVTRLATALLGALLLVGPAAAAGGGPVEGGALPGPLPLFPPDNWWNLDVSGAPVDPGSATFINFINNGGTRALHPDF